MTERDQENICGAAEKHKGTFVPLDLLLLITLFFLPGQCPRLKPRTRGLTATPKPITTGFVFSLYFGWHSSIIPKQEFLKYPRYNTTGDKNGINDKMSYMLLSTTSLLVLFFLIPQATGTPQETRLLVDKHYRRSATTMMLSSIPLLPPLFFLSNIIAGNRNALMQDSSEFVIVVSALPQAQRKLKNNKTINKRRHQ